MKLIEYDGSDIKVADEAFLIRPIRNLFQRDKSHRHEDFFRQMSYLWFMVDPRSTYMYITDEDARAAEIKIQEGFGEDWKPSPDLEMAMQIYSKHVVTTASLLLQSMRKGVDNLRKYLEEADLTKTDDKGKLLYPAAAFTSALRQSTEIARDVAEAEKAITKDFEEDAQARGNASKSIDEDD